MNKNLIAVAITAAMIAPATAMAGATFYGHAQVEVTNISHEQEKEQVGASAVYVDKPTMEVADNARGRIGMKASEDLGNGWKGLAVFEFRADTSDGSAKDPDVNNNTKIPGLALTPREHMVGVKGGAGQFELGRLRSAYKYTGGVKYDSLVTTSMEARGNGGMSKEKVGGKSFAQFGTSSFISNSIGYRKGFGPVKLSFTYGPETDDGSLSASLAYKKGGLEVFGAYVDAGDLGSATNKIDYSSYKLGGKFKMGNHTFKLQYEGLTTDKDNTTEVADADKKRSPTYTFLGYDLKMGKNVFVFQYALYDSDGQMKAVDNGASAAGAPVAADRDYLALAIIHNMSKQTRIFAGYRDTSTDFNGDEAVISVGVRKTFKGGS
ncbi:MAG: porin [Thiohalomonadales bacterium]